MLQKRHYFLLLLLLLLTGTLAACAKSGQGQDAGNSEIGIEASEQETEEKEQEMPTETDSGGTETEASETTDLQEQTFADGYIAEQTFEVQMSEFEGKVWFVPYAPTVERPEFRMEIMREGEVLTELYAYIPEYLAGAAFESLDAVSFFDVNYDGNTDIVLVETYSGTSFPAIYYGTAETEGMAQATFDVQVQLSEQIAAKLETVTIPEIRALLTDGKKNGEFADYREAYQMVSRLCELESGEEVKYNLIYFDEDETPELVAGVNGYYMSLYTWQDGNVYLLMDRWSYGVMGNAGYEYCPRKNSLRNYNSDFAGAIVYTTYMKIGDNHTLEDVVQIETYNFDDGNENGIPDEDEMESFGYFGENYIDGRLVSDEECEAYAVGEYEYMEVQMSAEEL